MKKFQEKTFYHFYKALFGLGLRCYYKKICVTGLDKIPLDKPIITASNHPTGLMDVFLASHVIQRPIQFTAAGSLFNDKLQAAFLTSVGTIPIYRRKDSPGEQDKNLKSFEQCFKQLESGGAIGFYPEGTSHPEPWINPIKTGVTRVALQAEDRNQFELNLLIVPIGINAMHPGKFRSSVFVNIGNPISLTKYREIYKQDQSAAVRQLTAEIQQAIENCAFHIQNNTLMNIFEALNFVGIDEDIPLPKSACKVELIFKITKAFKDKIKGKKESSNETSKPIDMLAQQSQQLKQLMERNGIYGAPFHGIRTVLELIGSLFILILAFPIIFSSIVVNIWPFMLAKKLGKKLAGKDLTLVPAGRLMMGTVIFIIFYLLIFTVFAALIGFLKAIAICIVLLFCSYLTLWCWEILKRAVNAFRKMNLRVTHQDRLKELTEMRNSLFQQMKELLISNEQ